MKALWIRADKRTVEEADYVSLSDLQRMVGGTLCVAHRFDNKDVVFVDDDGMMKRSNEFFILMGGHQPFCGNGVLVGRERRNSFKTFEPRTQRDDLDKLIRFCQVADLMHEPGCA